MLLQGHCHVNFRKHNKNLLKEEVNYEKTIYNVTCDNHGYDNDSFCWDAKNESGS